MPSSILVSVLYICGTSDLGSFQPKKIICVKKYVEPIKRHVIIRGKDVKGCVITFSIRAKSFSEISNFSLSFSEREKNVIPYNNKYDGKSSSEKQRKILLGGDTDKLFIDLTSETFPYDFTELPMFSL